MIGLVQAKRAFCCGPGGPKSSAKDLEGGVQARHDDLQQSVRVFQRAHPRTPPPYLLDILVLQGIRDASAAQGRSNQSFPVTVAFIDSSVKAATNDQRSGHAGQLVRGGHPHSFMFAAKRARSHRKKLPIHAGN